MLAASRVVGDHGWVTPELGPVDTSRLRLPAGPVDLRRIATDATPGLEEKEEGAAAMRSLAPRLADLQERLWAAGQSGSRRRVLLVLQGMDTSGKGGTIRKALGLVDPQGLQITSFKAPTPEELRHDFLWRIRRSLPDPGRIGVFDRSHYEDVLVQRVRSMAEPEEIERRYAAIREFEAELVADEVSVVKCMLHVSADVQRKRLRARLDNPEKYWKYNPGDVDERAVWSDYRSAYEVALERTDAESAPWFVVPADKKWFRNLAVAQILAETLVGLDLGWPAADFDVEVEKARLEELVVE